MSLMPKTYLCSECGKFHEQKCPNKQLPSLELIYPTSRRHYSTSTPVMPKIICLCGSTKFKDLFLKHQKRLTLQGIIVLSVGLFGHADNEFNTVITPEIKIMLDQLHLRKIDLADEVHIICPGNYIGESTSKEITYAMEHNRPITMVYE